MCIAAVPETMKFSFSDSHKEIKVKNGVTVSAKNEPRYPCTECDRVFYTKSSMEGHLNRCVKLFLQNFIIRWQSPKCQLNMCF